MNPTLEDFAKFHGDKVTTLLDDYYNSLKKLDDFDDLNKKMNDMAIEQKPTISDDLELSDDESKDEIFKYDTSKCMCRLFNVGISKQCSYKKVINEIYCTRHLKKFNGEGIWGYGLIDEVCPSHHVKGSKDEGKRISWKNNVMCNKKIGKKSVKQSINVRKDLDTKFDETNGIDKCFKCNNESSNNQFSIVNTNKYCLLCYKSYLDDLNIDTCKDCDSNPCDCDTESLSDEESKECNDLLTKDTNDYIYYQGVHYYYDESTNIVALNYEEVGIWNVDNECIDWYNENCMNKHLNHPNYISK